MSPDETRLLANVNARAQRLFESGYRADWLDDHLVEVTSPRGETYEIDTVSASCSCPFFVKHQGKHGCKHLLGYEKLLSDQEKRRAHNAAMWEALA
jgi:predicted nucleic acid-binding Zn finger protein